MLRGNWQPADLDDVVEPVACWTDSPAVLIAFTHQANFRWNARQKKKTQNYWFFSLFTLSLNSISETKPQKWAVNMEGVKSKPLTLPSRPHNCLRINDESQNMKAAGQHFERQSSFSKKLIYSWSTFKSRTLFTLFCKMKWLELNYAFFYKYTNHSVAQSSLTSH